MIESSIVRQLANLRLLTGYLGEKGQFAWWPSAFLTPSSGAFLDPVFSRTRLLAQCSGVTRAAALIHDERIGVGHVYHLFRLPEALEQRIHELLRDSAYRPPITGDKGRSVALQLLEKSGKPIQVPYVGPAHVGEIRDLYSEETWLQVAGLYVQAFQQKKQVFPYLTDRT